MLLLLASCSFSTYDYTPCENSGQCRSAFGPGWVCGESGFCDALPPLDRCSTTWPEDLLSNANDYKDTILVGTLFSRDPVDGDIEEALAAELAIRQVGDNGGLEGRNYGMVHCDYTENTAIDNQTATEAIQADAQYLANLGVPFIVGPATSSMSEDAYPIIEAAGVMLISPSATSPSLTDIDGISKSDADPGLFWRTAPPDDLQGRVIATEMVETLGVSHVAVIYESSNYGQALAEVFKDNFEANNGHTAELFAFDEGNSTGRDDKVSTVGASVYDEVLFISGNIDDLIAFLNGAATWPNYENMGIFLTDAGRDVRLIENTSDASSLYDQIRGTAPSVPTGTVYGFFESGFSGTYSPAYTASSSSYTAYAYDAAWLGLYGTAWSLYQESDACVGDDDGICGLGTARGLRHISDQNATDMEIKATSWNSVKATFETGQSVNVAGASGSLDYDPLSGETTGPIDIWEINDARDNFDTITTITP